VRIKHKYADGGKVVKQRAKPTASPGVGGAIKDFVKSVSNAFAPKSVTQRKSRLEEQEKAAYRNGGRVKRRGY
jgi:hypothetical protein